MLPYIQTESGFQTLVKNKSFSVEESHPYYNELFEAVVNHDEQYFLDYYSKEKAVNRTFDGTGVVVKDGEVLYGGQLVHGAIVDRILGFVDKKLDPKAMMNFLENLMENPSSRAVNELYTFLEHQKLPITDDGCFIAYKSVTQYFKDKYTGKLDNSPGQVVELPRNQVDDQKERECSYGLHVGALNYAGPGGWYNSKDDRVVIVKVNPRDAVSVPQDHGASKLRVCRYEVLDEYKQELDDDYFDEEEELFDNGDDEGREEVCGGCLKDTYQCDCIPPSP